MQEHDKVDKLLRKIELQWNSIEALEKQIKKKKQDLLEDSQILLSFMDILQTKVLKRPNGFKAQERVFIDFEITDQKAFFGWLKANLTPDEVINILTPPTKTKDLKEMLVKKYESCLTTIDGIFIKYEYVTLNYSYPKTEKELLDEYKEKSNKYGKRKNEILKRPYRSRKS